MQLQNIILNFQQDDTGEFTMDGPWAGNETASLYCSQQQQQEEIVKTGEF